MPNTVVVITEDALLPVDVEHIQRLAGPDGTDVRLIVPSSLDRGVVAAFLDHLAVLELSKAWDDLTGSRRRTPAEKFAAAEKKLIESVERFANAGTRVVDAVIADDVILALEAELTTAQGEIQVFAVTQPHAVEDTFHRGWADRIEEQLGVAVLHFNTGTSTIDS